MKLGVLGGTFDPPHVGHVRLAEVAIEHLALDKLLFVPAGEPWRKAGQPISAAEHRLEMTWLAVDSLPRMDVSTLELDRPGPSYTRRHAGRAAGALRAGDGALS